MADTDAGGVVRLAVVAVTDNVECGQRGNAAAMRIIDNTRGAVDKQMPVMQWTAGSWNKLTMDNKLDCEADGRQMTAGHDSADNDECAMANGLNRRHAMTANAAEMANIMEWSNK